MKAKRVLFFVDAFPTLSETFILNQIKGAVDAGHDVHILALHEGHFKNLHPLVKDYNLLAKTTYLYLPTGFLKRATICIKQLKKVFRTLNPIKYGKIVFRLQPAVASAKCPTGNYDFIIAHYGNIGLLASILCDQHILSGQLITFFHGYDLTRTIQKRGKSFYRFLFQTNAIICPISQFFATILVQLGANENHIKVHHMGVDIQQFPFSPKQSLSNELNVLIVARLTEKKGIKHAIMAMKLLQLDGLKCQLQIIGDGEEKAALQAITQNLGLQEQIIFHGAKSQTFVKEALNQADVFLLPSVVAKDGDMEGIPVSLMEAMATGKPVIATKHSGIPELIADKVNGFLVTEKSAEEICTALKNFYTLPNPLRQNMLSSARNKVEYDFNIHHLNRILFEEMME
jgi:colanic acid/amylovoran biosynthesis glycosyltransferase